MPGSCVRWACLEYVVCSPMLQGHSPVCPMSNFVYRWWFRRLWPVLSRKIAPLESANDSCRWGRMLQLPFLVLWIVLFLFALAGSAPVTDSSSPAQELVTRAAQLVALERQATEVGSLCLLCVVLHFCLGSFFNEDSSPCPLYELHKRLHIYLKQSILKCR